MIWFFLMALRSQTYNVHILMPVGYKRIHWLESSFSWLWDHNTKQTGQLKNCHVSKVRKKINFSVSIYIGYESHLTFNWYFYI